MLKQYAENGDTDLMRRTNRFNMYRIGIPPYSNRVLRIKWDNSKRYTHLQEGGLEAHRDTVGVINISFVYQDKTNEFTYRESINRMMAYLEVVL